MNKNQILAASLVGALIIPFSVLIIIPTLLSYIYEIEFGFYTYVGPGLTSIASIWMFAIIRRRLDHYYREK